jgi:hypothetical protein
LAFSQSESATACASWAAVSFSSAFSAMRSSWVLERMDDSAMTVIMIRKISAVMSAAPCCLSRGLRRVFADNDCFMLSSPGLKVPAQAGCC